MKKIITIMGAVLLTASTLQIAAASERDTARRARHSQPVQTQQVRDSNAYYAPANRGLRDDGFGYGGYNDNNRFDALREGGAISAPAGH